MIDIPAEADPLKKHFEPVELTIQQGDTIRWVNNDEDLHIFATIPGWLREGQPKFSSPEIGKGKSYEIAFDVPGDYPYFCYIHVNMVGLIHVTEKGK